MVKEALRSDPTAEYLANLNDEDAPRFMVGDMLRITKASGWIHWLTILGIRADGTIEAAFWNGKPNYFETTIEVLSKVRIIETDRMDVADVEMYRLTLGI